MKAFYNEIDPYAAQWLRNLIAAGELPPGVVDTRSIADIRPEELHGFTQCHFFAGVGVWAYALRQAGWPDDRPVWTGSCPCQPFSAAGAGAGFDDERHLWPAFFHHIEQCRPPVVFGEQVASKAVNVWIDLVQADLEAVGYAVGALAFPSAGVGAPHIRDRCYWVADAAGARPQGGGPAWGARSRRQGAAAQRGGAAGRLADTASSGRRPERSHGDAGYGAEAVRAGEAEPGQRGATGGLAHAAGVGQRGQAGEFGGIRPAERREAGAARPAGATNGVWSAADWLLCRDGKWRPVEPCSFPLAHGTPARVGRLRAYGNAINAEAAIAFIEAYEEARAELRRGLVVETAARELVEDLL